MGLQAAFPVYLMALGPRLSMTTHRLMFFISITITVFGVYNALFLPAVELSLIVRPAPLFRAENGLHSSAYIFAAILIYMWLTPLRAKGPTNLLRLAIIAASAVLLIVYQVRSAQTVVGAFFIVDAVQQTRMRFGGKGAVALATVAAALFFFYVAQEDSETLSTISSGRTFAYGERIDELAGRSAGELLLGKGAGSDLIFSNVWKEKKGSHNDFLTTLLERGIFGEIALIMFVVSSLRRRNVSELGVLIGIYAAGMISNGPMTRPVPLFFLSIALSTAGQRGQQYARTKVDSVGKRRLEAALPDAGAMG